jgi:hypothetical protein
VNEPPFSQPHASIILASRQVLAISYTTGSQVSVFTVTVYALAFWGREESLLESAMNPTREDSQRNPGAKPV